ncbi:MAG: hypothetical protein ACLR78_06775 [Roseburia sp.]
MADRFEESFRKLARYILDHVDHTDGDAVVLAFALFRAGEKENLGIRDLEKCLTGGRKETGKKIISGKHTGKEKLYEAERKMVGNMGQGQQESCRDTREKSKWIRRKVQIF